MRTTTGVDPPGSLLLGSPGIGVHVALTVDAEMVIVAVRGLDCAGDFHLVTLVLGSVYAPSNASTSAASRSAIVVVPVARAKSSTALK